MFIRKTTVQDLPEVYLLYERARDFMRENGNPDQWKDGFPSPEIVGHDIAIGNSYVCVKEEQIATVFYFNIETEPSYLKIDGQWLDDRPYGVVHRIASSREIRGTGMFCLDWCFNQCRNLRIDTHRDNIPMRNLLNKLGFTFCGIIWLEDGDERLAFQKVGK